jgi:hypothetical protein
MGDTSGLTRSPAERWLHEAIARVRVELATFFTTFAAFGFRPRTSALAWQSGERVFMNPLGFAATAAGAYWAIVSVLSALWPIPGSESADTIGAQITSAIGPYVHYGLLGIAMHVLLRLLGSRRPALGSIGIAFFIGGSIGTSSALILSSITRWFGHVRGTSSIMLAEGDLVSLAILFAGVSFYLLVCLMLARGLMGLHRVAAWKMGIAVAFAILITALLFGSVIPDGSYGWRPYLRLWLDGDISFGFRG